MDLNLNANWRLLRIFDPLLQRSKAGRAVFVTSGAATLTIRPIGVPTLPPRLPLKHWFAPMRKKATQPMCGLIFWTPVLSAPSCG